MPKAACLAFGAELGRQVVSAINTPNGDIIAIGTNEVPRFRGGALYWPGDTLIVVSTIRRSATVTAIRGRA